MFRRSTTGRRQPHRVVRRVEMGGKAVALAVKVPALIVRASRQAVR